jgi:hypothetical protein
VYSITVTSNALSVVVKAPNNSRHDAVAVKNSNPTHCPGPGSSYVSLEPDEDPEPLIAALGTYTNESDASASGSSDSPNWRQRAPQSAAVPTVSISRKATPPGTL